MSVRPTTGDAYREWGEPTPPVEPRVEDGAHIADERAGEP